MRMPTSPDASVVIQGRCFCGAVRFRLSPPTDFVAHCHCTSCRVSHGVAFVTWTSVPIERFAFEVGEANIAWYQSSEHIAWGFCRTCGSSMLYRALKAGHPEAPKLDRMYVAAGSLVSPLDRAPAVHVSYEERVPWLRIPDGLPKHRAKTDETLPE